RLFIRPVFFPRNISISRFLVVLVGAWFVACCLFMSKIIQFADNGGLKMLYDNRMYPQAVAVNRKLFVVWREYQLGHPYIVTYDLEKQTLSEPKNLISGYEGEIDKRRYRNDHHFAPVIWSDTSGYLHVLHGCHLTKGIHLISEFPGSARSWVRGPDVGTSISYPKIHRINRGRTLLYSRYQGHLGYWQYQISGDGGRTWSDGQPVVDLNAEPQDGRYASHAGSYNTTAISSDGNILHVAFIWKVEDPLHNSRYGKILHDYLQRYNVYYLYVDLSTGHGFNIKGEPVELPLTKHWCPVKERIMFFRLLILSNLCNYFCVSDLSFAWLFSSLKLLSPNEFWQNCFLSNLGIDSSSAIPPLR
ncbi:MAG: glycoside hydrolase, partial [Verrucomicrobiae bacterium]|nr:glycoside hydrolase [Verrucomicrobiae bacterium]